MIFLANLLKQKLNADFLDYFNRLLYKNGFVLVWGKDATYNIFKGTDLDAPVLTVELYAYNLIINDIKTQAVAVSSLTPDESIRSRVAPRLIFELITKAADLCQLPIILKASDFLELTTKFNENNLIALGFHEQILMDMSGIRSNFEYVRLARSEEL